MFSCPRFPRLQWPLVEHFHATGLFLVENYIKIIEEDAHNVEINKTNWYTWRNKLAQRRESPRRVAADYPTSLEVIKLRWLLNWVNIHGPRVAAHCRRRNYWERSSNKTPSWLPKDPTSSLPWTSRIWQGWLINKSNTVPSWVHVLPDPVPRLINKNNTWKIKSRSWDNKPEEIKWKRTEQLHRSAPNWIKY